MELKILFFHNFAYPLRSQVQSNSDSASGVLKSKTANQSKAPFISAPHGLEKNPPPGQKDFFQNSPILLVGFAIVEPTKSIKPSPRVPSFTPRNFASKIPVSGSSNSPNIALMKYETTSSTTAPSASHFSSDPGTIQTSASGASSESIINPEISNLKSLDFPELTQIKQSLHLALTQIRKEKALESIRRNTRSKSLSPEEEKDSKEDWARVDEWFEGRRREVVEGVLKNFEGVLRVKFGGGGVKGGKEGIRRVREEVLEHVLGVSYLNLYLFEQTEPSNPAELFLMWSIFSFWLSRKNLVQEA